MHLTLAPNAAQHYPFLDAEQIIHAINEPGVHWKNFSGEMTSGIDLQKSISQSIALNKIAYKKYLTKGCPDQNIDHRRVKVLATYFRLEGLAQKTKTYEAGDILVFDLEKGVWHIAIVSDRFSTDTKSPLILHNICCGVKEEDILGQFPVIFCFRLQKKVSKSV